MAFPARLSILALLFGFLFFASGCELEEQPFERDTAPEDARSASAPEVYIPKALDDDGMPLYDEEGLRFRDYSYVMHAVSLVGGLSRDSELGHPDFRPELSEDLMRERGEFWLDMVSRLQATFDDNGDWAPYLVETPDGWMATGAPDLADYAQGVYTYHTHHRASRWADHGLEDDMARLPSVFTTAPGVYLLDNHYADGRFYWDADHTEYDHESIANGVSGLHAHIYAWVRWEKPGGADDHGELSEDHLMNWMQYSPEDLADIARELAATFDEAWDDERGAYRFDDDEAVTYRTESVGALLRGQAALIDVLHMFGNDADEEHIDRLFTRSTDMLTAVMNLAEPWGLPERIRFTADGPEPASETADVAGTWSFVNHISGGYSYTREREGTAQLLTNERPDLLDEYGAFVDTLLEGALDYQLQDGTVVSTLDYETGAVQEDRRSTEAITLFLLGAGNAYDAGEAFAAPGSWDGGDVAERSRALYNVLVDHTELLEEEFVRSEP